MEPSTPSFLETSFSKYLVGLRFQILRSDTTSPSQRQAVTPVASVPGFSPIPSGQLSTPSAPTIRGMQAGSLCR